MSKAESEDTPSKVFTSRLEVLQSQSPGSGWDGIWTFSESENAATEIQEQIKDLTINHTKAASKGGFFLVRYDLIPSCIQRITGRHFNRLSDRVRRRIIDTLRKPTPMSGGTRPMPTKLAKDRMCIPQGSAKRDYYSLPGSCHSEIGNYMRNLVSATVFLFHLNEHSIVLSFFVDRFVQSFHAEP